MKEKKWVSLIIRESRPCARAPLLHFIGFSAVPQRTSDRPRQGMVASRYTLLASFKSYHSNAPEVSQYCHQGRTRNCSRLLLPAYLLPYIYTQAKKNRQPLTNNSFVGCQKTTISILIRFVIYKIPSKDWWRKIESWTFLQFKKIQYKLDSIFNK